MHDPRTTSQRRRAGAATCLLALALLPVACKPQAPAGPVGGPPSSDPATVGQDFQVLPVSGPTIQARATTLALTPGPRFSTCLGEAGLAKPLGLHRYPSEEALHEDLPGEFLVVDPTTLLPDSRFHEAYFNSAMDGDFRQSTMAVTWHVGEPKVKRDPRDPKAPTAMVEQELTVAQFTGRMVADPPLDPHQQLALRGQVAYGFNVPFDEGMHNLIWKEGCRWISVSGPFPAADLLKIAQGLKRSGQP